MGCLALMTVLSACEHEAVPLEQEQSSYSIHDVYTGKVLIMPRDDADGADVGVAVDVANGEKGLDGVADRLFALQRAELPAGLQAGEDIIFEQATVRFTAERRVREDGRTIVNPISIVVEAPEQGFVLTLALGDEAMDEAAVRSGGRLFHGYGLSSSTGQWPITARGLEPSLTRPTSKELELQGVKAEECASSATAPGTVSLASTTADDGAVTQSADCDDGGPGASSCSTRCGRDECSVGCQSGYYACCSCRAILGPKCECIESGGGGGSGPGGGGGGGGGSGGGGGNCQPFIKCVWEE